MSMMPSTIERCLLLKILLVVPAGTVTLLAELPLGVDRVVLAPVVRTTTGAPVAMGMVDPVAVDPVVLAPHAPVTIVRRAVISTPTADLVALLMTGMTAGRPVLLAMTAARLVRMPTVTTDAVALRLVTAMIVEDASHLVGATNVVRPVPTPVAMGVQVPIAALVVILMTVARAIDRPVANSQMTAAVRMTVRAVILMTVRAVRAKVDVRPLTETIDAEHRVPVDATLAAALVPRTESVSSVLLRLRSRSASTLSGLPSLVVGVV